MAPANKDDVTRFIKTLEADIIDGVYSIDNYGGGAFALECDVVSELIKDEK